MARRNAQQRERVNIILEGPKGEKLHELPFIMGVLADLRGHSRATEELYEREFVDVQRKEDVDTLFEKLGPSVNLKRVPDRLSGEEGRERNVEIQFRGGEEAFDPLNVIMQVPALKALLDERQRLASLLDRLTNDPKLADQFQQIASNPAAVKNLLDRLGSGGTDSKGPSALAGLIEDLSK